MFFVFNELHISIAKISIVSVSSLANSPSTLLRFIERPKKKWPIHDVPLFPEEYRMIEGTQCETQFVIYWGANLGYTRFSFRQPLDE